MEYCLRGIKNALLRRKLELNAFATDPKKSCRRSTRPDSGVTRNAYTQHSGRIGFGRGDAGGVPRELIAIGIQWDSPNFGKLEPLEPETVYSTRKVLLGLLSRVQEPRRRRLPFKGTRLGCQWVLQNDLSRSVGNRRRVQLFSLRRLHPPGIHLIHEHPQRPDSRRSISRGLPSALRARQRLSKLDQYASEGCAGLEISIAAITAVTSSQNCRQSSHPPRSPTDAPTQSSRNF